MTVASVARLQRDSQAVTGWTFSTWAVQRLSRQGHSRCGLAHTHAGAWMQPCAAHLQPDPPVPHEDVCDGHPKQDIPCLQRSNGTQHQCCLCLPPFQANIPPGTGPHKPCMHFMTGAPLTEGTGARPISRKFSHRCCRRSSSKTVPMCSAMTTASDRQALRETSPFRAACRRAWSFAFARMTCSAANRTRPVMHLRRRQKMTAVLQLASHQREHAH